MTVLPLPGAGHHSFTTAEDGSMSVGPACGGGAGAAELTSGSSPSDVLAPDGAAPFHCGSPMASSGSLNPAPAPAFVELAPPTWVCACGFRMDADRGSSLGDIWAAAATVESLQWQLDSAQQDLETLVINAAAGGRSIQDLQNASGLGAADLVALLNSADGRLR